MYLPRDVSELEKLESCWACGISGDGDINFCVWVLQIDGLSIPSFSHHSDGDHSLQNQGLNAESWQSWLARVVATKHPYLDCHVPNIQAKVAEEISSKEWEINKYVELIKTLPDDANYVDLKRTLPDDATQEDWSRFRASIQRRLINSEQQYQQAVRQLGDIPRNVTPPELWNGVPAVREQLTELWQRYKVICEQSQVALWETLTPQGVARHFHERYSNVSWSDLEQYQSRLNALMFYVVEYPEPIEYIVPPISILISQPEWKCENEDLRSRTLSAAERLANLSTYI